MCTWFSQHLAAMGEASLVNGGAAGSTIYRLLYLPTWGHPVAIRVEERERRLTLTVTELTGAGGYAPGTVRVRRQRPLSGAEWRPVEQGLVRDMLESTVADTLGNDGSEWVLEAVRGGKYALVMRWTPEHRRELKAFADAGRSLFALAGADIQGP